MEICNTRSTHKVKSHASSPSFKKMVLSAILKVKAVLAMKSAIPHKIYALRGDDRKVAGSGGSELDMAEYYREESVTDMINLSEDGDGDGDGDEDNGADDFGGSFRVDGGEDEIDAAAEAFIRRFHKQTLIQKQESFKWFQEMMERSV